MIAYPNAKLNLGLNILRRRPDGFHDMESVFLPVNWRDLLEVEEDSTSAPGNVTFTTTGINVPADGKANLCERAYRLLHDKHRLPAVKMHLHKQIPIGAGLGGGSADATFTLRVLNERFALGEDDKELEVMAAISCVNTTCLSFTRKYISALLRHTLGYCPACPQWP